MSIEIKEVNVNDVEKIAVLFNEYRVFYKQESNLDLSREFISQRVQNNESVIYCAFNEKEEALGFTQLYPSFSSVWAKKSWILNDLYVNENHRKKGIARMLMQKAKDLAITSNSNGLFLQTAHNNKNAQALYESEGYEKDEEYYSYFLSV